MLAAGPGGVRSPNAKRPGFVSNVLQQAASNMLTDLLGSVVGSALGMGGAAAGAAGAAGEVTGPARGARGACPEVQGGSRLGPVLRLGPAPRPLQVSQARGLPLSGKVTQVRTTPSTPTPGP